MSSTAAPSQRAMPPADQDDGSEADYAQASSLKLVFLCNRLQVRMNQLLEEQGRVAKLSGSELMALLWLSHGPSTVSHIASAVGLQSNGMSILLDRLSNRGLVTRRRSRQDRRVVVVSLTLAGRDQAEKLHGEVEDQIEQLLSAFSESERLSLLSMLERLAPVQP